MLRAYYNFSCLSHGRTKREISSYVHAYLKLLPNFPIAISEKSSREIMQHYSLILGLKNNNFKQTLKYLRTKSTIFSWRFESTVHMPHVYHNFSCLKHVKASTQTHFPWWFEKSCKSHYSLMLGDFVFKADLEVNTFLLMVWEVKLLTWSIEHHKS